MISLTGGTFAMGSNDDLSEKPIHRVTVKPFAISKFPITNREWNACVAAKACTYAPTGKDDAPVTNVSWNDAQQFIAWLSQRSRKSRSGCRAKPNGSTPRAAAPGRNSGGAINCNPAWPTAKDAVSPTMPHSR